MTASPVIASDVRASAGFHRGWRLLRFVRGDSGRKVARLIIACLASLLLYALAFGFVVDRPLALGFLQQQIDAKLARATSIERPKLVILAGSNGPYSHRCEIIEPILRMPCVNGGVAVGIGLDYLFARWRHSCTPAIWFICPWRRSSIPAAAWQRISDRTPPSCSATTGGRLAALPPQRWVAALFSFDLRAALMGPIEARPGRIAFPRPARGHDRRDQRVGRSCRSHRRTRSHQPGRAGVSDVTPCHG